MSSLNSTSMMTKKCAGERSEVKFCVPQSSAASFCDELIIDNYSNFKRSCCPERFMFYENGSWVDYPKEVAEVMKLGFSEGMIEFQGSNCLFDFYRMLETELESRHQRSISWIDVDGKCFFPKVFINSCENDDSEDDLVNCNQKCPNISIDVNVNGNPVGSKYLEGFGLNETVELSKRKKRENVDKESIEENSSNINVGCPKIEIALKYGPSLGSSEGSELTKTVELNKRKRDESVEKETMEVSSLNINAKRRQMVGSESQLAKWLKARILGAEQKGYVIVKNLFLSGLAIVEPGVEVTAIHQSVRTGPLDKACCQVFEKQMEIMKRARGESNMVFAWYGTSAEGVKSILMHGFGMPSISKMSQSEGHGIGIYLSPVRSPQNSAMLSDIDEHGEKHAILCRVILGKCEKVEAGSQQLYPSSVEYDTGVDDLKNPKWYTVWHSNMNTHILPEYVVSYSPVKVAGWINCVSNVNSVPDPTIFVAKLLSKLRSYLPLPRVQELQSLYGLYKEGKLGKHTFMKQLRSVVGDDVLRSTIQEVRG